MKRLLPLLIIPLAACGQAGRTTTPATTTSEMRTIENTEAKPGVIDPPSMLSDEGGAAPKPHAPIPGTAAPVISEKDEQLRASLPFAPAIAMDPIDGSKISILADTPTVQTKTRLYYFSSEDHKREFLANPEQYMKGAFSKL